jgi:hypothetical protein
LDSEVSMAPGFRHSRRQVIMSLSPARVSLEARFQKPRLRRFHHSASSANPRICDRGVRTATNFVNDILMSMSPHFARIVWMNHYRAPAEPVRTQFAGGSLPGCNAPQRGHVLAFRSA